jgi:hypothetical protein
MAVGLERAHAELIGAGLAVVLFGRFDLQGIALCGDVAEESEGPGLMCLPYVQVGQIDGSASHVGCVLPSPGQETGLAQPGDAEREAAAPDRGRLVHRLLGHG